MICKYFMPFCGLPFYSLDRVFWCIKVLNLDEVQVIYCCLCFWCHSYTLLLVSGKEKSHCYAKTLGYKCKSILLFSWVSLILWHRDLQCQAYDSSIFLSEFSYVYQWSHQSSSFLDLKIVTLEFQSPPFIASYRLVNCFPYLPGQWGYVSQPASN